ncbi:substrate-binding periplasmic protein [Marinobacter fonticola]|uniref:substrate-binding periplasmic protein n=1 Tax=Marinobacter fonticola TaxID=2603215 RepID=UPI001D0DB99D|nr:transporter substrate-binding domain-containing protein [Marinobacter fonticola]
MTFSRRSLSVLKIPALALFALLAVGQTFADAKPALRVGLEPLPPLINENRTGYSIEWLQAVAEEAGMALHIRIMPYSRAKVALITGQVDLIGHTPRGLETGGFYDDAVELNHRVPTKMDAFALTPAELDFEEGWMELVGTPFGNSAFIADLTGVTRDRFVEASLTRIVNMLVAGRVHAVVFERMSVVTQLHHQASKPVYYRLVKEIDAGFAVRKDNDALLKRLNAAAQRIDAEKIYAPYENVLDWPDRGTIEP